MAKFVIADLTDTKSLPHELASIVPFLPSVPVQPLLLASEQEWAMYERFPRYPWVLDIARYDTATGLLANLADRVIGPAERWLSAKGQCTRAASTSRALPGSPVCRSGCHGSHLDRFVTYRVGRDVGPLRPSSFR